MIHFIKSAGDYTAAEVRATAWALYARNIRNYRTNLVYTPPTLDRRYKFNREVIAAFREILNAKGYGAIEDKQKSRARRSGRYVNPGNILNNRIVRDYYEHRHAVLSVRPDRLVFAGRNHWARDQRERRILAILAKNFQKYNEE